jgi:Fe-S oxidoreductase
VKISTRIEDVGSSASLCIRCHNCTYGLWPDNKMLCPIYSREKCFTYSGGGLLFAVQALLEKRLDFSRSLADLAFTCAGCGACDSNCGIIRSWPPHVDPWDIIRLLRYESIKRGFTPDGVAARLLTEVMEAGDLGRPAGLDLPDTIQDEAAGTVIFGECAHTGAQREISRAVASLLGKIGDPVRQFAEKGCCGSSLYDFGFWEQLGPLMEANWEKMKELGDRTFVFINPHCQEFITRRYPENVPGYTPIKSRHISQLLADALKEGKLKSKKTGRVRVSYHDPCYLGRGLGIYDAPRQVIASLSGVEMVEMERNRRDSFCCGARSLADYLPDMSENTARERLDEFRATGADLLITACQYCMENFRKVLPEGDRGRIKDLSELVDERTVSG